MAIAGFYGSLGAGKDLLTNYFLRNIRDPKHRIITHTHLNIPHKYLTLEQIFDKAIDNTKYFFNSTLYLSEFHLLMESRRSTAGVNVDFSQSILIQLGKLDCNLWYSSQLLSQMDLRIKQMQKYFYHCEKQFRPITDITEEDFAKIDWDKRIVRHPVTNEVLPFDIYIERWIRTSKDQVKVDYPILPWEICQTLFRQFDTREIIKFDRKKYLKK